jgi:hypothetical protein
LIFGFSEDADNELSLEESKLDWLFEGSVMEKNKLLPLDTIYKYTESHLKAQEDSLNRLDVRFSTFIGFSGVLIRLALDLPDKTYIKIGVCFFAALTIIFSSIGLTAKKTGGAAHPETLMTDEWFQEEEAYHQAYIINGWIEVIHEYEDIAKTKGARLNFIISLFTISTVLYAIGVGLSNDFSFHYLMSLARDLLELLR